VSDVTKEDSLTTFTEEQETIEDLKEFGGGLMNPNPATLGGSNAEKKKAYVQRIACPASARVLKNETIAQADCESRPEVGSSKKSKSLGLAASSTAMVVLLLCSTPSDPTAASA
jgi:hypothetical protein